MLRISEVSGTLRVNGEEVGTAAFSVIFREALGLNAFNSVCNELATHGVSVIDLGPVARGVSLTDKLSCAEAARAIETISSSHEAVGNAIEKLSEVMTALSAPDLMMILQLIAAREED